MCDWDRFNPDWYVRHNYAQLRDDDREILDLVADFFTRSLPSPVEYGLDVGSGANLYPALAMLAHCRRIQLYEPGIRNVRWLERERSWYGELWDPYWARLAPLPAYACIDKPREEFAAKVHVHHGGLFELTPRCWDVGTMFFVAESICDTETEFARALGCFVTSLRPGAPFAAAFMRGSTGYDVDGVGFPAVALTEADVVRHLEPLAHDVQTHPVSCTTSLREGYQGMVLALGTANR